MLRTSVLAVLMAAASVPAQRIYVDANAPAGGDGTSWISAYQALQPALAGVTSGAEVWVAEGTYSGGFVIPTGVVLRGGFRPGATRPTQARPMHHITVLDGGLAMRVLSLGAGSTVDGFRIERGLAGAPGGGGALVDGTDPTIRNCVFTDNGISGGRGAALAVIGGADPQVSNCLFFRNAQTAHTIDVAGSAGTYDHITVFVNPHNGFHIDGAATPVIRNSIFGRNGGRGICDVHPGNQPLVENCLFFQNSVSNFHYLGQEYQTASEINALAYATNNLEGDPAFASLVSSDYRLTATSPAIDRGQGSPTAARDPFGNPRVTDGDLDGALTPDIGFHEFSHVELSLSGSAAPGATLTLALNGTPGLPATLLISAAVTPGAIVPPLGAIYVGAPAIAVPFGPLPSSVNARVPLAAVGDLAMQAVVAAGPTGNLSGLVDLRVQ